MATKNTKNTAKVNATKNTKEESMKTKKVAPTTEEKVKVTTKEMFAATLETLRNMGKEYGFTAKELDAVKNVIKFYNADGKCVLYARACRKGFHFQMKESNVPDGMKYHTVKWQLPAVVEVATLDEVKVIFSAAVENKFAVLQAEKKATKEAEKKAAQEARKAAKAAEKKTTEKAAK